MLSQRAIKLTVSSVLEKLYVELYSLYIYFIFVGRHMSYNILVTYIFSYFFNFQLQVLIYVFDGMKTSHGLGDGDGDFHPLILM